jgi:hypothetical protein
LEEVGSKAFDAAQFAAKQHSRPSPPVPLKSACEHSPSGPLEEYDEPQDFEAAGALRETARRETFRNNIFF